MELLKNKEMKKEKLKEILKAIHRGESPDELVRKFRDVLSNVSPLEIPLVEQELVKEGIKPTEIARLCDIHVQIFKESVAGAGKFDNLPDGHPLKTLFEENSQILKDAEVLNLFVNSLKNARDEKMKADMLKNIRFVMRSIVNIPRTHYNREELILFPYLERRGLNAVPSVLWKKHDEIRGKIKKFMKILEREDVNEIFQAGYDLAESLVDMTFRENNILYPTVLSVFSEGEWVAIKEQSDKIGYYKVEPGEFKSDAEPVYPYQINEGIDFSKLPEHMQKELMDKGVTLVPDGYKIPTEKDFRLNTGYLTPEQVNLLLNYLPVDVTFIDEHDRVKFFSSRHRIFDRAETIIGRPVQLCHPPSSVHIVNKILKAFKTGEKDTAEFWLNVGNRFIHIQYFAVRDEDGKYRGTLEVTHDATHVRSLEGEKRLLDW